FITPIDAEDLYVMSERLDGVLNGAKGTGQEAGVMGIGPDEAVAAMAALLADGARHLAMAFERLDPRRRSKGGVGGTGGGAAAGAARRERRRRQRQRERGYLQAASALLEVEDLREVMGRRELYRRVSRISEILIQVADRVWYATVKEG